MHPIDSEELLKSEIKKREIEYTDHFLEDVEPDRPKITFELVEELIKNKLDELLAFEHKPDKYDSPRYNICFRKSTNYYVIMGVSFSKQHINLITSFPVKQSRGKPKDLIKQFG